MELSDQTPRQYYQAIKSRPARAKFGFGEKPALVNIDLQKPIRPSASSRRPTRPTPGSSTT
jgi:maleamate amidohydrolase